MFKKIQKILNLTEKVFTNELKALGKDSGALLILFGALIIYPLAYSVAYQKELTRELKTIVVDCDRTQMSRQMIRFIDATEQAQVIGQANSIDEARKMFIEGETSGIVLIPEGFEKDILSGKQTNVAVYADGSYFLLYRQLVAGSNNAIGTLAAGIEIKKLTLSGIPYKQATATYTPVKAGIHLLYNPGSGYGSFIMPGMVIIILQQTLLIGIGMMGGTTKEKRKKSQKVPSRLKKREIIPVLMGKTMVYFLLYLLNCIITMVVFHHLFDYPNKASYLHVFMLVVPFLLSVIFMGITCSVLFKRRESSFLFMVFLSPIVMFLSGISWPISSIPSLVYTLAHVFPTTIMVPAYLRLRIMGVGIESIRHEYFLLLAQMVFYFCTAAIALYVSARHQEKMHRKELAE